MKIQFIHITKIYVTHTYLTFTYPYLDKLNNYNIKFEFNIQKMSNQINRPGMELENSALMHRKQRDCPLPEIV